MWVLQNWRSFLESDDVTKIGSVGVGISKLSKFIEISRVVANPHFKTSEFPVQNVGTLN